MKFPAYGRSLWDRRYMGEKIRVVALLIGNRWKLPKPYAIPADVPIIAVKTAPWHLPRAERFDWRPVTECTVLAFDTRGPDEREAGPARRFHQDEFWDPWLWLLADAQRFARDVLRFTITEEFHDPPNAFAAERDLGTHAWLSRTLVMGDFGAPPRYEWPEWWPYANAIHERDRAADQMQAAA